MKSVIDFILTRAKEPSTLAALAGLVGVIGISPDLFTSIWGVVVAALGLAAMLIPG